MLIVKATLLLVATLALVEGFCYRKNPPKSQESAESLQQPGNYSIWVCVKSNDLTADLEKAPKPNISQVWVSMSTVQKLQNDVFAKFADKLVKIEIWNSKLAEIEDGALKGLKELKGLILPRNELTTVKSVWFKDTSKLLELNLAYNRIQSIEIDFLKLVPALMNVDLRGNELIALPNDFVKKLPQSLRRLNIYSNPLNYKQTMEVVEWSKTKDDKSNEPKLRELKHVFNVTKTCLDDKTIIEKTNDAIDKCVDDKLSNDLTNAVAGNVNGTASVAGATTIAGAGTTIAAGTTVTTPASG